MADSTTPDVSSARHVYWVSRVEGLLHDAFVLKVAECKACDHQLARCPGDGPHPDKDECRYRFKAAMSAIYSRARIKVTFDTSLSNLFKLLTELD